jgi:hypothetical protein
MKRWLPIAIVLALAACGESARDALDQARKALAETNYSEAVAKADAGLARQPDAVTSWGLEITKLEALARAGRGDETLAQLERLTAAHPEHMLADQFAATADQLRTAGQGAAAVSAIDLGLKRFPDDAALRAQIEKAKAKAAASPDDAEMQRLKSLGYLN